MISAIKVYYLQLSFCCRNSVFLFGYICDFDACELVNYFGLFTEKEKGTQTMEDWDQETLEKIVESKRNEYNQNKPTDIVSLIYL